jgi:hypothetical protein
MRRILLHGVNVVFHGLKERTCDSFNDERFGQL